MSVIFKGSKPEEGRDAQEAVSHAACVIVVSRDFSRPVDGRGLGGVFGARRIEGVEGTVARPHEAVILIVCKIISCDCPRRVDGVTESALAGVRVIEPDDVTVAVPQEGARSGLANEFLIVSRDRSRRVDAQGLGVCGAWGNHGGEGTIGGPQEALIHEACVLVYTRDCSGIVDGIWPGGVTVARGIEGGEGTTVRGPQEAAIRAGICVIVDSRDCSRRVDAIGLGGAGERGIEWDDATVGGPEEAVRHGARVYVEACDYSRFVDAIGLGAGVLLGAGARGIECGEGPAGGTQKAVIDGVSVLIESRDCSWLVDGLGLGGYGARGIERGERAGLLAIQLQARNQKGHTGYFPNLSRSLELVVHFCCD
jgi:hypothetical protein